MRLLILDSYIHRLLKLWCLHFWLFCFVLKALILGDGCGRLAVPSCAQDLLLSLLLGTPDADGGIIRGVWFKLGFAACKASALTFVLSLQPPECHSLKLRFWLFCSVSESNLQVTCYTIDFPCLNISYRQWVITGRSFALQKWIFKSHWSNKGMLCFLQVLALQLIYSLEYFLYLLPWRLWYIDHCKPPRILDHFEVPVIFSPTPSS